VELKRLMRLQAEFDKDHPRFCDWSVKITDRNLEVLQFLMVCMIGELGEFANTVKKVIRGDFSLASRRKEIEEEITDVFIYLVKICNQMDIDLEVNFLKKLEKNKGRFKERRV